MTADELAVIEAEKIIGGMPLRRLRDDVGDHSAEKKNVRGKGRGRAEVVVELNKMGTEEKRRYSTPRGKSTPSRAEMDHDLSSEESASASTSSGHVGAPQLAAMKTAPADSNAAGRGEEDVMDRGDSSTLTIDAVSHLAGGSESDGTDLEAEIITEVDHAVQQSEGTAGREDTEAVNEEEQEDGTLDGVGVTHPTKLSTPQSSNRTARADVTRTMSSEQSILIDFTGQSSSDSGSDEDDASSTSGSSDSNSESDSDDDDEGSTSETSNSGESEDSDEEDEKLERLLDAAKLSAKNASSSKQNAGSADVIGLGEEEDVLQLDAEEDTNDA